MCVLGLGYEALPSWAPWEGYENNTTCRRVVALAGFVGCLHYSGVLYLILYYIRWAHETFIVCPSLFYTKMR